MKKLLAIMLVTCMSVSVLAGCGAKTETAATDEAAATEETAVAEEAATTEETAVTEEAAVTEEKEYKIGVIQLVEHAALDAANQGFIDGLNESGIKYSVDQQNAQGQNVEAQPARFLQSAIHKGYPRGTTKCQQVSSLTYCDGIRMQYSL